MTYWVSQQHTKVIPGKVKRANTRVYQLVVYYSMKLLAQEGVLCHCTIGLHFSLIHGMCRPTCHKEIGGKLGLLCMKRCLWKNEGSLCNQIPASAEQQFHDDMFAGWIHRERTKFTTVSLWHVCKVNTWRMNKIHTSFIMRCLWDVYEGILSK